MGQTDPWLSGMKQEEPATWIASGLTYADMYIYIYVCVVNVYQCFNDGGQLMNACEI